LEIVGIGLLRWISVAEFIGVFKLGVNWRDDESGIAGIDD